MAIKVQQAFSKAPSKLNSAKLCIWQLARLRKPSCFFLCWVAVETLVIQAASKPVTSLRVAEGKKESNERGRLDDASLLMHYTQEKRKEFP